MKFYKIFIILIGLAFFYNCKKSKEKITKEPLTEIESQEVELSENIPKLLFLVHTPDMKFDHFKNKGLITREDFIKEFEKVNWKEEVDLMAKTFSTKATRLEVVDGLKYLSISVGIGGEKTGLRKEFSIGIGDIDIENNERIYFIDLYGTKEMNKNKVIEIINLFFNNKSNDLLTKLNEFDNYVYVKDPHDIKE